jgi:hypothetical protein
MGVGGPTVTARMLFLVVGVRRANAAGIQGLVGADDLGIGVVVEDTSAGCTEVVIELPLANHSTSFLVLAHARAVVIAADLVVLHAVVGVFLEVSQHEIPCFESIGTVSPAFALEEAGHAHRSRVNGNWA